MPWCAAATVSCRSTSMCPAVRPPPRRWSTASCCCSGRSAAPEPSSAEMADLAALTESIKSALGGAVTGVTLARGELTIEVAPAEIMRVMAHLQGEGDFKILVDICGVDWPQRAKRFDVVYHLLSLTRNVRVRVKAQL